MRGSFIAPDDQLKLPVTLPIAEQVRLMSQALHSQDLPEGEISKVAKMWFAANKTNLAYAIELKDFTLVDTPEEQFVMAEDEVSEPQVERLREEYEAGENVTTSIFEDDAEIIDMSHVPSLQALGMSVRNKMLTF